MSANSPSASPMETEEGHTKKKDESAPMPMDVDERGGGMDVTAEEDATQAINILRNKEADTSEKIAAANKLERIAQTLGEERTRSELLPFLSDIIDEEDEVLSAISAALGKLVPFVGGPSHVHNLLKPLELFLSVEETVIRQNAQESAELISASLPTDQFHSKYTAMITRLAKKHWYNARKSACELIASSFERFSPAEQEIQAGHFAALCRDDNSMVRKVAAKKLGDMVLSIAKVKGLQSFGPDGILTTTFLPLYIELATSEQPDAVRLHTAENCIAFGKGITSILVKTGTQKDALSMEAANVLVKRIVPLVAGTIEDRSWRVRWTAASKFATLIDSFKELEGTMDILIPAYEKLLEDPEAEVKTAATLNLADVARCNCMVLSSSKEGTELSNEPRVTAAQRLVKKVKTLTEDDSENVRAALAMVATDLAPLLGKEATIADLIPQVLILLRDVTSEVRLNVISSLESLDKVIGIDLLSQSLLPAILDLAADQKWRIRLAIMQHIPLLAKQLGKEFFTEQLVTLCIGWLGDEISSIREAGAENLKELTNIFGSEWAIDSLIPPLDEIRRHSSYLRRLIAVQAFVAMATVMEPELSRTEILPLILFMATDNVANIRFNVAKGLKVMAPICGPSVTDSQIRPILAVLSDDTDIDVRYFADQTIESLDKD